MLGDERVDRGFAWPEYEAAGALLFSTDAPTAPFSAVVVDGRSRWTSRAG